jgi:hypothetical protein
MNEAEGDIVRLVAEINPVPDAVASESLLHTVLDK